VEALVGELLPIADDYVASLAAAVDTRPPSPPRHQRQEVRQQEVTAALVAYSLAIAGARPSKEMALREWRWRNGWFWGRRRTPAHGAWLRRAGVGDDLML